MLCWKAKYFSFFSFTLLTNSLIWQMLDHVHHNNVTLYNTAPPWSRQKPCCMRATFDQLKVGRAEHCGLIWWGRGLSWHSNGWLSPSQTQFDQCDWNISCPRIVFRFFRQQEAAWRECGAGNRQWRIRQFSSCLQLSSFVLPSPPSPLLCTKWFCRGKLGRGLDI